MKARTGTALAISVVLGSAMAPIAALAQVDSAAQALINQLSFSHQTRGMRVPQTASAAPVPGPQTAGQASGPRIAAARTPAPAPTTTAPAGVPAASLSVEFATGSARLTAGAITKLDSLGVALTSEELASYRFRIEGHTDTVGSAENNLALSERRAIAVRDYLVERFRISPDRLVTEGMGETRLLVPTPDETDNFQNRRVQVLNLGS